MFTPSRQIRRATALAALFACAPLPAAAASWSRCRTRRLPRATPAQQGMIPDLTGDLKALLADAVRRRLAPSIALIVVYRGKVVFRGAAGRAKVNSIFDLASLTKVVSTTPLLIELASRRRVRLSDGIGKYLPTLAGRPKGRIQLQQLLLHTGGLAPVIWAGKGAGKGLRRVEDHTAAILRRIRRSRLRRTPGAVYRYSDVGFILLGRVVERVGGRPLARAARRWFDRLGMCDTGYRPPARVRRRLVSPWPPGIGAKGVPYDPLAARMKGVAGHAGLFSTLDDLARYGQLVLRRGRTPEGKRVLAARFVDLMLRPHPVPATDAGRRALGWRMHWPGAVSGPHRAAVSYGHTGYTGTSLWIDPQHQLVVALLANRTRNRPKQSVALVRRRAHQLVRGALIERPRRPVLVGLDRLVARRFKRIRGTRVGLITNATATDRRGRWIVDLMLRARLSLKAIFVPEHGLRAAVDRHLRDHALRRGGRRIPVYSLYGARRRPTPATLRNIDTLVFDVQAVGVRFYTYLATMGWAMEAAARHKLRFVVLDRPNPLGGVAVEGPVSSARRRTSTNYHPLPVRHGMTIGELAALYNHERRIGARLEVVPLSGWRRQMRFDHQGRRWINPSPNIRSWRQAQLYAAVGLLESTNLAVGRGTGSPFNWFGAPWANGVALAAHLNGQRLPGVFFAPVSFVPRSSRHRRKRCRGVRLLVVNPDSFRPVATGIHLALALRKLHADRWDTRELYRLINDPATTRAILAGRKARAIVGAWQAALKRFRRLRRRYLNYR